MEEAKDNLHPLIEAEKVIIDGKEYALSIGNNSISNGRLIIRLIPKETGEYLPQDYKILIDKRGVTFSRGYHESEDDIFGGGGTADCNYIAQKSSLEKLTKDSEWSDRFPDKTQTYVTIPLIQKE